MWPPLTLGKRRNAGYTIPGRSIPNLTPGGRGSSGGFQTPASLQSVQAPTMPGAPIDCASIFADYYSANASEYSTRRDALSGFLAYGGSPLCNGWVTAQLAALAPATEMTDSQCANAWSS